MPMPSPLLPPAVYFGFKHQFERGYKAAMAEGVRQYVLQVDTRGASPSQPAAAQ